VLQAGFRNKNDRNDARGIADLMRVNTYRPVWVKSPEAQRQGRLLTARAACNRSSRLPGAYQSKLAGDLCHLSY
jgi:transposase